MIIRHSDLKLSNTLTSMSTNSNTFEVQGILNDQVTTKGESLFLVSWKDTTTTKPLLYATFTKEMKSIFKKGKTFVIVWKDTWMTFDELKDTSDEILGAYLLLKLYNYKS